VIAKFAASGKVQAKKSLGLMQMQYRNKYEGKYICRNSHSQNRAIPKWKFEIARMYEIWYPHGGISRDASADGESL
jgi:hypothetical protein